MFQQKVLSPTLIMIVHLKTCKAPPSAALKATIERAKSSSKGMHVFEVGCLDFILFF